MQARQIYENLAKDKFERKPSGKININNENEVEQYFSNTSSDEVEKVYAN